MSKKKPRSKDPHSWIRDTTKKPGEGKASAPESSAPAAGAGKAEEPGAAEAAAEEVPEGVPRRSVVVEYDRNDGGILATHEMAREAAEASAELPASSSEGSTAARITLTGELFDKTLLDIHENYRVDVSKARATLVPKS